MPIKVSTIDLVTKENIRAIVHYYNANLPKGFEPIEFVEYKNNSLVGSNHDDVGSTYYGFRIPSTQTNPTYSNGMYKHMRWQRKTLVSIYNFPPFSQEEEIWLFRTMGFVWAKSTCLITARITKQSNTAPVLIIPRLVVYSPGLPCRRAFARAESLLQTRGIYCRRLWSIHRTCRSRPTRDGSILGSAFDRARRNNIFTGFIILLG
jgi:hypothetical protein